MGAGGIVVLASLVRSVSQTLPVQNPAVSPTARAKVVAPTVVAEAVGSVGQMPLVWKETAKHWWMAVSPSTLLDAMVVRAKNVSALRSPPAVRSSGHRSVPSFVLDFVMDAIERMRNAQRLLCVDEGGGIRHPASCFWRKRWVRQAQN